MVTVLICLIVCSIYSFIIYHIISYKIGKKIDNKSFLKDVRQEIASLITQINETSDRNVQLLEHRLDKLNKTLDDADRKILQLKIEGSKAISTEKKITIPPTIQESPLVEEVLEETETVEDDMLSQKDRIILLHRQGISPSIIATKTKSTIGEVELIITLDRG